MTFCPLPACLPVQSGLSSGAAPFTCCLCALRVRQVEDPAVEGGFTSAAFHPDGVILGTGTEESLVRVWEVRQQKVRQSSRLPVA
jgi:hypothetical protein